MCRCCGSEPWSSFNVGRQLVSWLPTCRLYVDLFSHPPSSLAITRAHRPGSPLVEHWQQKKSKNRGSNQPANDNAGEGPLNFSASRCGKGHGNESEAGHEC